MGKSLSTVWIMMMMILAVTVIADGAKSRAECNRICIPHCKPYATGKECSDCHKACLQSPPFVKTKIQKNQNNNKKVDIFD
ncbi:hypothetical protein N665_0113s0016 [Sinapis alba]|nr:hypothetical protein N665_0113s0015 [Sinapis alba]KAF8108226.1 hypothetical protein N665_0113s0016 [Sinapis alba]